ncbi:hypothetical protein BJ138DRAFT_1184497 [Hygrophoropsis aurantiaca]|uniref:Uncharacterized protein n=1 Tax=Hygrophoropsis aurantiaca TaxID=72124 RepID=A0ACB7ZQI7_9AGAM|nr:hypothetical protein BJ138DRAFT_1184497 [Hygrophoropsis aurantiaca]
MTAVPAPTSESFAEKNVSSPIIQTSAEHDAALPELVPSDNESQQLLKDILQPLKSSTIAQEIGTDSRSRFRATYKREATEFDDDFLDRYKEDMDIVLIFMIRAINTSAFADHTFEFEPWDGPGLTVIWTLLAALGAVLGQQWLSHYRQRISGTIEERLSSAWSVGTALKPTEFDLIPVEEFLPTLAAFTSGYQDTYGSVKLTILYNNPEQLLQNLRRNMPSL